MFVCFFLPFRIWPESLHNTNERLVDTFSGCFFFYKEHKILLCLQTFLYLLCRDTQFFLCLFRTTLNSPPPNSLCCLSCRSFSWSVDSSPECSSMSSFTFPSSNSRLIDFPRLSLASPVRNLQRPFQTQP